MQPEKILVLRSHQPVGGGDALLGCGYVGLPTAFAAIGVIAMSPAACCWRVKPRWRCRRSTTKLDHRHRRAQRPPTAT